MDEYGIYGAGEKAPEGNLGSGYFNKASGRIEPHDQASAQCSPKRETALSLVTNRARRLNATAEMYYWFKNAINAVPPRPDVEEAIYLLISSTRD